MQEDSEITNLGNNPYTSMDTPIAQKASKTSPKQVLESAPKKSKKWIVYSLTVILLLLIGITSYICYKCSQLKKETGNLIQNQPTPQETTSPTPTSDPTANWKVYSNTTYSVSFKYPENWKFEETQSPSRYKSMMITLANEKDMNPIPIGSPHIIIHITESTDKDYFSIYSNSKVLENINVDGISAEVREPINTEVDEKYIVLIKDGNTYTITSRENSINSQEKTFNRILSTLKFTNQPDNFSYKNFSMNYPNDWSLLNLSTDKDFPLKERLVSLYSDEKVIALSKNDIYMIVTIESGTEAEAGGIFMDNTEYNNFITDKNPITIEGSTFYLNQNHNSIDSLSKSHAGPYGWSALAEYVPSKTTQSGTYKGYENIIKRNGYTYNFIVVSDSEGKTDVQTQGELVEILESINW